ncbi:MAG: sixA [Elusimicrobia bacterium]|nr:MAG: sixA [Elusimicrobiota bacterium]
MWFLRALRAGTGNAASPHRGMTSDESFQVRFDTIPTMRLIIMRHGQSPSAAEAGVKTDHDRPLAPEGREDARRQAGRLTAKGYVPDVILHSPLTRAKQTAYEVRKGFADKPRIEEYEPLSNQLRGEDLFSRLKDDGRRAGLTMLVGHMPQVGELAGHLTGVSMGFEPAGLVVLEASEPGLSRVLLELTPSEA